MASMAANETDDQDRKGATLCADTIDPKDIAIAYDVFLSTPNLAPPTFAMRGDHSKVFISDDELKAELQSVVTSPDQTGTALAEFIKLTNQFEDHGQRIKAYQSLLDSSRQFPRSVIRQYLHWALKRNSERILDVEGAAQDSAYRKGVDGMLNRMRSEVSDRHQLDVRQPHREWYSTGEVVVLLDEEESEPWSSMSESNLDLWTHEIVRQALILEAELDGGVPLDDVDRAFGVEDGVVRVDLK